MACMAVGCLDFAGGVVGCGVLVLLLCFAMHAVPRPPASNLLGMHACADPSLSRHLVLDTDLFL